MYFKYVNFDIKRIFDIYLYIIKNLITLNLIRIIRKRDYISILEMNTNQDL